MRKKTSLLYFTVGGLFTLAGLWSVLSIGSGADTAGPAGWSHLLGLILMLVGAGLLLAGWRRQRSTKGRTPESDRLADIKDQALWRGMAAADGRVTASELAAQAGAALPEVERALMSLVAEGRAVAEPGDSGQIVYRIESLRSPAAGA